MFIRYLPFAVAFVLTALPASAQDTATHNRQTDLTKGMHITIEGCVARGEKADTFVLATVTELGGPPVETGKKRVYWLDSPKHVRSHVGKHVRITGRIRDLERSEIELESGAGPAGVVTIEGPGRGQVTVAPATIGVGTAQAKSEVDIPITLVKIDVDNVKAVRACGPATATVVRPPR